MNSEMVRSIPTPYLRSPRRRSAAGAVAVLAGTAAVARYHGSSSGWLAAFAAAVLVVLAAIDIESRRVPNAIVVPAGCLVLGARLILDPRWSWVVAAFAAALCFFVLAIIRPGALGMGDVKLVFLMGALLGSAILAALVVGTVSAAVVGLLLIARQGADARRSTIPYAPFLVCGALVVLLLAHP
jgi:leader peptidase (prepilin peptidase) / N-methyltransferase